ncbi:DNA repair protein [Pseudomonas oryzihabitans]|uniref:DNA repair protein n=1 Tax=Pseudomonas oryzihabitans TaxID=47885 RepID=A0A0U4P157_9PSED|nr:DNA repair protein [Pseudomonas oryzihabitans]ALZ84158.1 DNA repair protein [Pseudomonas oryzihabitans]
MIGSCWNKWDLHIHSPFTNLNNGFKCEVEQYVANIKENSLSLLGVTNYWYFQENELEIIREELRRQGCSTTVIGNLEFRVAQPNKQGDWINVHCLFSESLSTAQINAVVSRLKLTNTTKDDLVIYCSEADFATKTIGCDDAIVDFKSLCEHMESNLVFGRDYLIAICPNGYGGYRPDINEGRSRAIASEIDKKGQVLFGRPQDRDFFLSSTRYEGATAKPIFFCSDAHRLDQIGTQYSWVKAKPNFQGLKQVLFEPSDRIYQTDDFVENSFIKPYFDSIEIEGPIFQGQEISFKKQNIPLNKNMIAIIGGRGTGKSLFLDAMHSRLAVCYGHKRVRGVSVENLRIRVSQGGDLINFDQTSTVPYPYLHVSQGEIHEFAKDPSVLSLEIKKMLGLRQRPFDPALSEELMENMGRYRSFIDYWGAVDTNGSAINKPDYQQNIININSQLIATLTNEQNAALISRYQDNNRLLNEQRAFLSTSNEIKSFIERTVIGLNDRISAYNGSAYAISKSPPLGYTDVLQAIAANVAHTETSVAVLAAQNEEIKAEFAQKGIKQDVSSLLGKVNEYRLNIDNANAKLQEIQGRTSQYFSEQKRRAEIAASYDTYLESLRGEVDIAYASLLAPNADWNAEQNELVQSILKDIQVSGSILFDKGAFYSGLEECVNRGKFRASAGKSTSERLAETFNVHNKSDFFKMLMGHKLIQLGDQLVSLEDFFWSDDYFNQGGRFELFDYLYSPSRIKNYLKVNAEFSYKGKSVEKLSVGQRGTFYVCLKLATDPFGSPFVFDQPEDDLDNGFIMGQLVPLFKQIKKYRQVIIVTHNANLVVNSDAEQVIVAENDGEVVSYVSGALEEGDVRGGIGIRSMVCSILEGGHEAFANREKKYGL